MNRYPKIAGAVIGTLMTAILASCETPPPKSQFPELSYSHLEKIRLDVAGIDIKRAYKPPGRKPHVEHQFPVVPVAAVERWVRDRLRAVGATRRAVVTIREASVIEVALPLTRGVRGAFTIDQSERYDGTIDIMVEIVEADGRQKAMARVRAKRSKTVPEGIPIHDREKMWFDLTEALMNDLNASIERQLRQHLARYLR